MYPKSKAKNENELRKIETERGVKIDYGLQH